MNYSGDAINAGLHQRLSRRRNFQLLRDVITSYNENIRVNNQYMIEYIQSMQDIINYMNTRYILNSSHHKENNA